jgi:hypothetical protein
MLLTDHEKLAGESGRLYVFSAPAGPLRFDLPVARLAMRCYVGDGRRAGLFMVGGDEYSFGGGVCHPLRSGHREKECSGC